MESLVAKSQEIRSDRSVPAECLYEMVAQKGWRLQLQPLPTGHFACDAWKKTLTVGLDMEGGSKNYREHLHWMIAVGLGHIELLSHPRGVEGWDFEGEKAACEFALNLLLPPSLFESRADVIFLRSQEAGTDGKSQWRRMCRLARHFQVPVACVKLALRRRRA